jgi:hypothetical protein
MFPGRMVTSTLPSKSPAESKIQPGGSLTAAGSSRWWLAAVLCFGFALRLAILLLESSIELDGVVYAEMGENFAKGAFGEALKGVFPPFYPLLIGLFHLFIPDLEVAARLVSMVMGLGLIWVSFLFFRDILGEEKALWGAAFVAIHPYLARYSAQALSESTGTMLFTAALFLFYRGWTRVDLRQTALSAVLLAFMYLTRPEYVVYAAPLALLLLAKRRFRDAAVFLFCFVAIAFPYVWYMRAETGMWIISKKAVLMKVAEEFPGVQPDESLHRGGSGGVYLVPAMTILNYLRNLPFVAYHFAEAMFVPFFLLMILGYRWLASPFKTVAIVSVITHIFSVAVVISSIRRFSVPFIPSMMVFAAEGFGVGRAVLARSGTGKKVFKGLCVVAFLVCLSQGITFGDKGRQLDKQAGLYLLKRDPGALIASGLPLTPFYARGRWADIDRVLPKTGGCDRFEQAMRDRGIGYLSLDEKSYAEYPMVSKCTASFPCLAEFRDGENFVKIFRIGQNRP